MLSIGYLQQLGGTVHTSRRIDAATFRDLLSDSALTLCDISPRQLLALAGDQLQPKVRRAMERFQPGPGAFKIDYALSEPVPWRARECRRAITVHLGGTFEEIAASEDAVAHGRIRKAVCSCRAAVALRPDSRAARQACSLGILPCTQRIDLRYDQRIEAQIERFAPGFRDCILARSVSSPAVLESMDANLIGGDISGGAMTLRQFLFRPTALHYATGTPISISALRPRRPAEAFTACAASMPQTWLFATCSAEIARQN